MHKSTQIKHYYLPNYSHASISGVICQQLFIIKYRIQASCPSRGNCPHNQRNEYVLYGMCLLLMG